MIHIILGLTLLTGTILSFQSKELILYYAAYYGLCLFALKSINYGKDFYLSFSRMISQVPEKKVLVAGENVAPRIEEDKQEDRFLGIFATDKIIKRRVLTWLLFFAGLWFFHFKQGIEFSLNTVIPLLSCVLIVNSFYVGHFLIALLLNLVMVVYGYSQEVFFPFYILYTGLFLASLYVIGTKKESLDVRKIIQLMSLSALLLGLCFGFAWFLPENMSFDIPKKELTPQDSKMLRDQLRKMKVDLGKMQLKLPTGKTAELLNQIGVLESMAQQPGLTDKEREAAQEKLKFVLEEFKNTKAEFEGTLDLGGFGGGALNVQDKETIQKLKDRSGADLNLDEVNLNLKANAKELEYIQAQLGQSNLSEEQIGKLQEQMNQLMEEAQNLKTPDKLTTQERNTVQSFINRNPDKDTTEASRLFNQEKLSAEDRRLLAEQIENLNKLNLPENRKEEIQDIKPETEQDLLKTLSDDKTKEKSLIERMKKLLPLLIGAFILVLLNYLLRKKGIKKIEGADPQVMEELKEEWKKLKKLKLSPREEVIHYYNLFHQSLQQIHYVEHEAPPSCIIYEDMKEFHPVLEKSTLVMTEVFAQCYYGEKNVTPDALKLFRKAVGNILKVYQLT